jgi:DNA mismatch endonuclease (patch repair protein)
MARVRQKHTAPELAVRSAAHRAGMRFSLHTPTLPGRPDLVMPARRLAVFVHGCFWHRHEGCAKATTPKANAPFWRAKFKANMARDARNLADLRKLGWRVAVIWECDTTNVAALRRRLQRLASRHLARKR